MLAGWTIKLLRLPAADVIIVGTDPPFSQVLFPLLRLAGRKEKFVNWSHDLWPEAIIADGVSPAMMKALNAIKRVMRWAYGYVDVMVDLGRCMRKRLDAYGHRAERITLVTWALVEQDALIEPDPDERGDLFGKASLGLLYSGTVARAHDFEIFLKLARILRGKSGDISFCFACRGNRFDELKAAITPEDTNVSLAPFAPESELKKRLNAADIHLMSLRPMFEGIVVPSKFFGSLAVGRPVIFAGPESSAIAGWIREFDVGMVIDDGNLQKTADELLELMRSPEKLQRWKENALRAHTEHFSYGSCLDQWDTMLRGRPE
jgi:glycosyltransferase involved in cell wall biosynthesis